MERRAARGPDLFRGVRTLKHLERVFRAKGINARCDFRGHDVNRGWPRWFRRTRYFLPCLPGEK